MDEAALGKGADNEAVIRDRFDVCRVSCGRIGDAARTGRGLLLGAVSSRVEQGPFNYAPEPPQNYSPRRFASGTAYCVRTCDGRYFPAPATNQSPVETCKSFCPAADTRVFYGPSIDDAASEAGRSYSELPNAFKYRTELVAGCSCNGSDPVGLAKVRIEDDKTLRRGDLVVAADGIKIATGRVDKSGASAELTPAPRAVRSRLERRPSIAAN